MPQHSIDVRSVNSRMASGAPARAATHKCSVRNIANVKLTARRMHLSVAFKAKVIVALHQHLVRDRPMRLVAHRAAFP